MSPQAEPVTKSAEATKAGHRIVRIEVERNSSGTHVTLLGGGEIRKLFEVLSRRDGIARPQANAFGIEGLSLWMGGYEVDQIAPTSLPETPILGPWVLRHASLGVDDRLTFTLPLPHSTPFLDAQTQAVQEAGNSIFRYFHARYKAKAEARTAPGKDYGSPEQFFAQYLSDNGNPTAESESLARQRRELAAAQQAREADLARRQRAAQARTASVTASWR